MQHNNDRVQVDPKVIPAGANAKTQLQFALAQQHQQAIADHRRRYARGAGNAFAISFMEVALGWLCWDMGGPFWMGVAMFIAGAFFLLGILRFAVSQGFELTHADPPIPRGLEETE